MLGLAQHGSYRPSCHRGEGEMPPVLLSGWLSLGGTVTWEVLPVFPSTPIPFHCNLSWAPEV